VSIGFRVGLRVILRGIVFVERGHSFEYVESFFTTQFLDLNRILC